MLLKPLTNKSMTHWQQVLKLYWQAEPLTLPELVRRRYRVKSMQALRRTVQKLPNVVLCGPQTRPAALCR